MNRLTMNKLFHDHLSGLYSRCRDSIVWRTSNAVRSFCADMLFNNNQQSIKINILAQCKASKGPDALGNFLFILRKKLSRVASDKCARWFLDLPNFVKAYQTSKTPSSCLGASQIFVRLEICMIWSKMWIKKIWSLFLVGVFQYEAR